MYRDPHYYADDPAPEDDEVITPRHLWAQAHERVCDACLQQAVCTATIPRGENIDPAKFRLCHDHGVNVALTGGQVDLWAIPQGSTDD